MPCVHYKFKSSLDYKTLTFDGIQISVAELKRLIYEKEKIGKSADYDLQITNAQTKQVYEEESQLVQRNASVIIARIPVAVQQKLPKVWDTSTEGKVNKQSAGFHQPRSVSSMLPEKNDLSTKTDMSEEEKLKLVQQEATMDYDPSRYEKGRHTTLSGPPPPTYVCNRCHQTGHWIKNCPTLNMRRTTGIPKDELIETTPDDPQAMLTPSGKFAVAILHRQAYQIGKKEKPPFLEEEIAVVDRDDKREIPSELMCALCNDILREAVVIRCCGDSFCDECIRNSLLESERHQCPQCGEKDISPDSLVPNSQLRKAVNNFSNEIGYAYAKRHIMPIHNNISQPVSINIPTSSAPSRLKINLVSARAANEAKSAASNANLSNIAQTSQVRNNVPSPEYSNYHDAENRNKESSPVTNISATAATSAASTSTSQARTSAATLPTYSNAHTPPTVTPSAAQTQNTSLSVAAPMMVTRLPVTYSHAPTFVATSPYMQAMLPPTGAPPPVMHYPPHLSLPAPPGVTVPLATGFIASQPPPPGVPSSVPGYPLSRVQPFIPPRRPLTEAEFYDAKRRLIESRFRDRRRSPRPKDAWEEFLARKDRKRYRSSSGSSAASSRSRSRSSSRSRRGRRHRYRRRSRSYRSGSRSRSRTRERHRRRNRSRSRSRSRGSSTRSPKRYTSHTDFLFAASMSSSKSRSAYPSMIAQQPSFASTLPAYYDATGSPFNVHPLPTARTEFPENEFYKATVDSAKSSGRRRRRSERSASGEDSRHGGKNKSRHSGGDKKRKVSKPSGKDARKKSDDDRRKKEKRERKESISETARTTAEPPVSTPELKDENKPPELPVDDSTTNKYSDDIVQLEPKIPDAVQIPSEAKRTETPADGIQETNDMSPIEPPREVKPAVEIKADTKVADDAISPIKTDTETEKKKKAKKEKKRKRKHKSNKKGNDIHESGEKKKERKHKKHRKRNEESNENSAKPLENSVQSVVSNTTNRGRRTTLNTDRRRLEH